MRIDCIERVLIATPSLEAAREKWTRAGFAISSEVRAGGIRFARFAAGAVELDLCVATEGKPGSLADVISRAAARGGGVAGWVWGATGIDRSTSHAALPVHGGTAGTQAMAPGLPGVFSAATEVSSSKDARREMYRREFGENPNSADYLDHIVVMAPSLEDAIASQEAIGLPCKRIREAGRGMRQAFFKLEDTVIEVVAPARENPGCWGLAFMCIDAAKAVAVARERGLQATEPKPAIQGGLIARIVDPIDGVSVAFMQAPAAAA